MWPHTVYCFTLFFTAIFNVSYSMHARTTSKRAVSSKIESFHCTTYSYISFPATDTAFSTDLFSPSVEHCSISISPNSGSAKGHDVYSYVHHCMLCVALPLRSAKQHPTTSGQWGRFRSPKMLSIALVIMYVGIAWWVHS